MRKKEPNLRIDVGDDGRSRRVDLVKVREAKAAQAEAIRRRLAGEPVEPSPSAVALEMMIREKIAVRHPSKRRGKGKRKEPDIASAKPKRDYILHEWGRQEVQSVNVARRTLRKVKGEDGAHVESFISDYELSIGGLKGQSWEPGAGAMDTKGAPLRQIEARSRLKELTTEIGMQNYMICVAVLVYGATPKDIAERANVKAGMVHGTIREAIALLADFYTPGKRKPDPVLEAMDEWIKQRQREAEGNA